MNMRRGTPGATLYMQFLMKDFSMTGSTSIDTRFTLNDIEVGSRLYEALVRHAQATQGAPIIYGDLLALAKSLHPEDPVVQRAVPIGIGMKLLFVEAFCRSHCYPNLACLAVNKLTLRPGPGYIGDWEADKRAVAAFDWSTADARLPAYISEVRSALPKKSSAARRTRRARCGGPTSTPTGALARRSRRTIRKRSSIF